MPTTGEVLELASLIAERTIVVHMPFGDAGDPSTGGRDVDMLAEGIDPGWLLRLPPDWHLCQSLHYDLFAWNWVVRRGEDVLILDVTEDPRGLGRDAFPTPRLARWTSDPDGTLEAAYVVAKRVRKTMTDASHWELPVRAVRLHAEQLREMVRPVFGERTSAELLRMLKGDRPWSQMFLQRAARVQRWRRFAHPLHALEIALRSTTRSLERLAHPTGLHVLIVGPDGSGKSTIASLLESDSGGWFRRIKHVHWRPGLLPRPGSLLRREAPDVTAPHARTRHSRAMSAVLLAYHWFDFFLAGWTADWYFRRRTGFIVAERGWWDVAVDPHRYGLDVSGRTVRLLGKLLPQPDLVFLLDASPEVVRRRKQEISDEEIRRQTGAWEAASPDRSRLIRLPAEETPQLVAERARQEVGDTLHHRGMSRAQGGWTAIPSTGTRWWIPRRPVRAAHGSLALHQPMTRRGQLTWKAARLATRSGALFFSGGQAPPEEVRAQLAPHVKRGETYSIARTNHRGRFVVLVVDRLGAPVTFAKVATDPADAENLAREVAALSEIGPLVEPPLEIPSILHHSVGLVLYEARPWQLRSEPWRLEPEVSHAIGRLYRAGSRQGRGPSHGDLAPWNLMKTETGWLLVDWESASSSAHAFWDPLHFFVQSCALLGRPTEHDILEGLRGLGEVGRGLSEYAAGAGLDCAGSDAALRVYLEETSAGLDPRVPDQRSGLHTRERLSAGLSRQ